MSDLPAGFDGIYRCKRHPERNAVAPIALRWCQQCLDDAHARYADSGDKRIPNSPGRDEHSTDDRSIHGEYTGQYIKRRDDE